jgi:putative heme transporter
VSGVLAAIVAAGFFYYVLPRIVGLGPTLRLLRRGDAWWLALGVVLEALSYLGAIVLFRGVFATPQNRIDWRASSEIMLAGAAATKLVAAAGAGGIALGVWALRGYGLSGAAVADGMVCYGVVTYGVYMAAMATAGYGLWLGLFSGRAPVAVTLVPAIFATTVILIVLSMLFVYEPVESFLLRRAERSRGGAAARWQRVAALPRSVHAGLLAAIDMVKRRDPSLLGALANWGFDIAVLWASFRAFGHSPPGAVLVMGYYVGTLANVLPFPGGIGGVEGGMIGAFLAFGVGRHLAVLAVLAYRTISYWLPTIPGAIAYWRMRRRFNSSPSRADAQPQDS